MPNNTIKSHKTRPKIIDIWGTWLWKDYHNKYNFYGFQR